MIALTLLLALAGAELKVGDTAPDFTVKDIDGHERTLSKLVADGPVILAFFPKAGTPGCTSEMQQFESRYTEVTRASAKLLAISTDDVAALKTFRSDLHAPYTFVADPDLNLVRLYDVKAPVVNYAKRTTFVVDGKRRITQVVTGSDAEDPSLALKAAAALVPAKEPAKAAK